jgi:integrase
MNRYQVVETPFSTLGGHDIPLIVINGEVDMFSAPFLLSLLNRNQSVGTIRIRASAIIDFYRFCENEKIDFPQMMASLTNFKVGQIEALSAFFMANRDTGELVAEQTYSAKMITTKSFIYFWWDTYQSRASNIPERLSHAKDKRSVMEQSFKLQQKTPWGSTKKTRVGLQPELRGLFWEIINPYSEINPFEYEATKWRNYLLFITLGLGGNRRGESVLLRLQDVQTSGREKYFEVVKDPLRAPRKTGHKINPSPKTRGRKVALTDDTAEIFKHYIVNVRPNFPGHLLSEFLFLSTRGGKPLSLRSINHMTSRIINEFPAFKGALSPHRLRNTFHDLLHDAIDSQLIENIEMSPLMRESVKQRIQEYAGGWAPGSKMTAHYPAGSIERKVWQMTLAAQNAALQEVR